MAEARRAVRRFRAHDQRKDEAAAEGRKKLDAIFVRIEAMEAERTKLEASIGEQVALLQTTMKQVGMETHEYGDWIAYYKEQKSNTSREVDPHKLYNKLSEKDFFACVKVSLTELATVMTESEINAIAKVIPGQVKGKKFTVERKAKKAKGRN